MKNCIASDAVVRPKNNRTLPCSIRSNGHQKCIYENPPPPPPRPKKSIKMMAVFGARHCWKKSQGRIIDATHKKQIVAVPLKMALRN